MLSKAERSTLRYFVDNSPNPNSHYLFTVQDIEGADVSSLERLCYLGLIRRVSMKPDKFQITPAGRQYFCDETIAKRAVSKEKRHEYLKYLISAIIGGIVTLLIEQIGKAIF